MTWTKFDDASSSHPKAKVAGNDAWALWAAAVIYCNRYGTDGFVPLAALATDCLPVPISMARAEKLAERLCACVVRKDGKGLFERCDTGYMVHDFLDWNPSKAEVDSKREKDRDRKRNAGRKPDGIRTDSGGASDGIPNGRRTDSETLGRAGSVIHSEGGAGGSLARDAKRMLDGGAHAQDVRFARGDARTWPEVRRALDAWSPGSDVRTDRDKRVLGILAWYSAGYSPDEVCECVRLAKADEFWRGKDLASLLNDPGRLESLRARSTPAAPAEPVAPNGGRFATPEEMRRWGG